MNFKYGTNRHELEFDVTLRSSMLEELQEFGFLDEDFDIDGYFDSDCDDVDKDKEIGNAIIDYYQDRAESRLEVECYKMNNDESYDHDFVNNYDDLDRIYNVATFDDFRHLNYGVELVTVRETVDNRGNN